MKLEVGKYYLTSDGRKVEVYSHCENPMQVVVMIGSTTHKMRVEDLIAEWQDEPQVSPATTRARILDTAKEYVTNDRQATHGKPEDTFGLVAQMWGAYLGREISPVEVCSMMALLKLARIKMNPKHIDSYVDLCGYGACAGELAGDIYG